jgi:hypothetical protein
MFSRKTCESARQHLHNGSGERTMMSVRRSTILAVATLVCACGMARPLHAQTAADTAALARAAASFLADSVLPQIRAVVTWQSRVPFGSAVLENLRGNEWLSPRADPAHTLHVGIGELRMGSDSAHVLVEIVHDLKSGKADRDSYDYVFAQTTGGWRFVRGHWVGSAYIGAVRGH